MHPNSYYHICRYIHFPIGCHTFLRERVFNQESIQIEISVRDYLTLLDNKSAYCHDRMLPHYYAEIRGLLETCFNNVLQVALPLSLHPSITSCHLNLSELLFNCSMLSWHRADNSEPSAGSTQGGLWWIGRCCDKVKPTTYSTAMHA